MLTTRPNKTLDWDEVSYVMARGKIARHCDGQLVTRWKRNRKELRDLEGNTQVFYMYDRMMTCEVCSMKGYNIYINTKGVLYCMNCVNARGFD